MLEEGVSASPADGKIAGHETPALALTSKYNHELELAETFYGVPLESQSTHNIAKRKSVRITLKPFRKWICL